MTGTENNLGGGRVTSEVPALYDRLPGEFNLVDDPRGYQTHGPSTPVFTWDGEKMRPENQTNS
jgi:hypothetical protein